MELSGHHKSYHLHTSFMSVQMYHIVAKLQLHS
jgi:hypothetical protein